MQGDPTKNAQPGEDSDAEDSAPKIEREANGYWKKGQSGNPGGRPKSHVSISAMLREKLNEIFDPDSEDKATYLDVILANFLARCTAGDTKYVKELLDRTEGKPLQRIEAKVDRKPNIVDLSQLSESELSKLETILEKVNATNEGEDSGEGG